MAVIDENDVLGGRIIFMEGWDGAATNNLEDWRLWPGWRGWQSASYCNKSPTWQAVRGDAAANHIYQNGHSPPGGFTQGYSAAGGQKERAIALQSPNFMNRGVRGGGTQNYSGLIYRTGSGLDSDPHAGFQDIVDCGRYASPAPVTGAVWLGFAFKFPSEEWPGAGVVGQKSGSQGVLKIWMGDSQMNGWDAQGISHADGQRKIRPGCTASNGAFIDPGEPNRWYNGGRNWFTTCGPDYDFSQFQERRVAIEISSGSVNNLRMYRSAQLGSDPNGEPVSTAWEDVGSYPITHDKWYWGVWEYLAETQTNGGRSKFYMFSNTVPSLTQQGDCRDTKQSTICSQVAFAFRGPNAGYSSSAGVPAWTSDCALGYPRPDQNNVLGGGFSMSGTWDNAGGKFEWEPNQQVWIDDIVMMFDKRPAESYCVILSASVTPYPQDDWQPVNTSSYNGAFIEGLGADRRVPQTGSWNATPTSGDEITVTKFGLLPYDLAKADIYGVTVHSFPTTDTPVSFGEAKTRISIGGGYTTRLSKKVSDTTYLETMGPWLTGQQVPISTMAVKDINPFTYIVSHVFYDGFEGMDLQGANINKLSASVKLRD